MSEDYNYVRGVPDLDDEIKRLRARQAVLVEALTELVAAGDNSVSATDDVAAMLRFGSAVDAARAALAQEEG